MTDEDFGGAMLLRIDPETCDVTEHEVSDFLKKEVFVSTSGERWVRFLDKRGDLVMRSLDMELSRYMTGHCALRIGGSGAAFTFVVFVLVMGRFAGSRWFWSLDAIYACLALSCFQGQASRWVSRSKERWLRYLCSLFGSTAHELIISSIDERGHQSGKQPALGATGVFHRAPSRRWGS